MTQPSGRAAIYARHSTDKQALSTSDQIDRCRAYCEARGYLITGVYKDEAVSGKIRDRPGLDALMADAREAHFQLVVTEDLSRLSRKIGHISDTYDILSFLGITIETVSNGTVSQIDVGLRGTMNALYLSDLADKTRRGMKAAIQRGSAPGGRTYGYRPLLQFDDRGEPIRGLREIIPEEADVIRGIFTEYLRGHSLARICEGLNTRGIPSPGGGKWYSSTLIGTASRGTGILRNQVYKGIIQFNKAEWKSHPLTGERMAVTRSEDEWITVDAPHLAIIPTDTFDRVQREMISRSSVRKAVVEERLRLSDEKRQAEENARIQRWRSRQVTRLTNAMLFFSGKLHCGWSGKKLTVLRKGMYSCKEPNCPVCTVYTDDIQPRALQALRRLSPQDILTGYQSPELEAKRESLRARIAAADAETAKRRKEIAAVLDTLSDQPRRFEIKTYLENKETELRQIAMRRSVAVRDLRFYSPNEAIAIKAVAKAMGYIKALEQDPMDHRPNKLLRGCIRTVTVNKTSLSVEWIPTELVKLLKEP